MRRPHLSATEAASFILLVETARIYAAGSELSWCLGYCHALVNRRAAELTRPDTLPAEPEPDFLAGGVR